MSNNNPSLNPANNGTLAGTLQFSIQKILQGIDGMLPAKVISYDREANRVQAQILITLVTTDGSQVPRPQIASLPVLILGAGNFSVSFPLKAGDLGWIMANDRDISAFLQSYSESAPNTLRIKNFSDGVFVPDIMKSYNISSANEDYMIIQSNDGLMSIELGTSNTGCHEVNVTAGRINLTPTQAGTSPTSLNPVVDVYGSLRVSGQIYDSLGTVLPGVPAPYPL